MCSTVSQPLTLDGSRNTRDLGGYPTANGSITKYKKFLRSDSLHNLTEADKNFLYHNYEVSLIVDLRSRSETQKCGYHFGYNANYINYPLLDQIQSGGLTSPLPPSMLETYIELLDESQATMAQIFRSFLTNTNACTIFHCTAGKDRTGITAMLLLKLAGVADEIIVADYAVSEENMKELFQQQREETKKLGYEIPAFAFTSSPTTMEKTLEYLTETYGSCEGYLLRIGMTEKEIAELRGLL